MVDNDSLLFQNQLFEVKYDGHFYELLFTQPYVCFVAVTREAPCRIVGVASVRVGCDDDSNTWPRRAWARLTCQRFSAYLLTMGVHSQLRGRGLAKLLLQVGGVRPCVSRGSGNLLLGTPCFAWPPCELCHRPRLATFGKSGVPSWSCTA